MDEMTNLEFKFAINTLLEKIELQIEKNLDEDKKIDFDKVIEILQKEKLER